MSIPTSPRGLFVFPAANFSCATLSSPRPFWHISHMHMRGLLCFVRCLKSQIKPSVSLSLSLSLTLSPSTFSQLLTAAWFNAVELSSQHLFGFNAAASEKKKMKRVWGDFTASFAVFGDHMHLCHISWDGNWYREWIKEKKKGAINDAEELIFTSPTF